MLNSNLNLNYSNQYYKSNLSISQNTNQPPSQTAQPDKPITDGVIFSKISKPQTITPNQEKTSSDNYQSRPTKAPKKPKTAAKRSKIPKRKRNILRDPHDKRSGTKLKSFNNNFPSKQRNRSKKSLDPNSNLEEGYCEVLPLRSKERMNLMEKSTSFVKNRGLNKGIANFSNNFIDANSRKPSRINSSNLAKENDQNRATEHGMYQKKEAEDPSQTQEPNEKLFQKKKSKRVAKSRRSKRTKTIRGVDIPKGQFYHNPTSGPMGLAENMDFRKQKGLSRQATFDSKNSKGNHSFMRLKNKISTITNNGECNGKELRIEGLMATQNSLSTKNSIVNRPLKIRNSGVKSEISENSDTGITLK